MTQMEPREEALASRGEKPRTFTAEITFNGLVVMQFLGVDGTHQRSATGIRILFVETHGAGHDHGHGHGHGHDHRHYPRLTYYADDQLGLLPRSGRWPHDYDYHVSPEGRQTVSVDLTDRRVEVIPFYSPDAPKELKLLWSGTAAAGGKFPDPNQPGDDQCLDWVLSGTQIGLEPVDDAKATTVIEPPPGLWRTHGIYRNREVRDLAPISWQVGPDVQAMGRDLVLEIGGLRYGLTVRISRRNDPEDSDPYDIVLTPGMDEDAVHQRGETDNCPGDFPEDRLKLALTNLPTSYTHADVSHVTMYRQLSGQSRAVESPTQVDDVVCAQSACTPIKDTTGGG